MDVDLQMPLEPENFNRYTVHDFHNNYCIKDSPSEITFYFKLQYYKKVIKVMQNIYVTFILGSLVGKALFCLPLGAQNK